MASGIPDNQRDSVAEKLLLAESNNAIIYYF
jgi:hypothetical protein